MSILRDTMMKLGGATLLFLGIGLLALGFIMENKSMEATGFIGGLIGIAMLYYGWAMNVEKPGVEEPEEIKPMTK